MKINVFLEKSNEEKLVNVDNINEIFSRLEINPQTVIVVKNGEVVIEDEKLEEGDKIKLLSVISGG